MNQKELKNQLGILISAYLPVLITNNIEATTEEALFCSHNLSCKTIVKIMTTAEMGLFYAPIKFMLEQKNISMNYSEEFVRGKFLDIYHKILQDGSKIETYVDELVHLINPIIKEYFVLSEIENIRILDDSKYELIDCVIKLLRAEDIPLANTIQSRRISPDILGRTFKAGERINVKDIFLSDETSESDKKIIGKPVIYTLVKVAESEKAKELALHNFVVSINLLKLFVPTFNPVLKGCLLSGNQRITVINITDNSLLESMSKIGDLPLNTAQLSKNFYEQLNTAGIQELRKDNTISKVVKDSLYWYGLGLNERYSSVKLLNYVTVFEASLKKKDEKTELRKIVSERGAILLYAEFHDRKDCCKKLKQIYDERSEVVHKGVLIDNMDLASIAGGYAREVLITLIRASNEFSGDFDKFIDNLDDRKLGLNKSYTHGE